MRVVAFNSAGDEYRRMVTHYYNEDRIKGVIAKNEHRVCIGGAWDEIGPMQLAFLQRRGLTPDMTLIDIGCGCMRGGVHFAAYLEAGNYYGIDISQALLDVGYDVELRDAGLQHKVPRSNLRRSLRFELDGFGVSFDVAIAQSVFTHLTWNHFKLCLFKLTEVTTPNSVFYATFFLPETPETWHVPHVHKIGGIKTYPDRDPFHYAETDIENACAHTPWVLEALEDWNHPRDQKICTFRRR